MWPLLVIVGVWWLMRTPEGQRAANVVTTYLKGVATQLQLADIGQGFALRVDAAAAFLQMSAAAYLDGVTFHVDSAWRTNEQQAELRAAYEGGTGAQAAPVGYSEHEGGLAVDINTDNASNAAYHWLVANAARFNFYPTVRGEPWHWSYRV